MFCVSPHNKEDLSTETEDAISSATYFKVADKGTSKNVIYVKDLSSAGGTQLLFKDGTKYTDEGIENVKNAGNGVNGLTAGKNGIWKITVDRSIGTNLVNAFKVSTTDDVAIPGGGAITGFVNGMDIVVNINTGSAPVDGMMKKASFAPADTDKNNYDVEIEADGKVHLIVNNENLGAEPTGALTGGVLTVEMMGGRVLTFTFGTITVQP